MSVVVEDIMNNRRKKYVVQLERLAILEAGCEAVQIEDGECKPKRDPDSVGEPEPESSDAPLRVTRSRSSQIASKNNNNVTLMKTESTTSAEPSANIVTTIAMVHEPAKMQADNQNSGKNRESSDNEVEMTVELASATVTRLENEKAAMVQEINVLKASLAAQEHVMDQVLAQVNLLGLTQTAIYIKNSSVEEDPLDQLESKLLTVVDMRMKAIISQLSPMSSFEMTSDEINDVTAEMSPVVTLTETPSGVRAVAAPPHTTTSTSVTPISLRRSSRKGVNQPNEEAGTQASSTERKKKARIPTQAQPTPVTVLKSKEFMRNNQGDPRVRLSRTMGIKANVMSTRTRKVKKIGDIVQPRQNRDSNVARGGTRACKRGTQSDAKREK